MITTLNDSIVYIGSSLWNESRLNCCFHSSRWSAAYFKSKWWSIEIYEIDKVTKYSMIKLTRFISCILSKLAVQTLNFKVFADINRHIHTCIHISNLFRTVTKPIRIYIRYSMKNGVKRQELWWSGKFEQINMDTSDRFSISSSNHLNHIMLGIICGIWYALEFKALKLHFNKT